MNIWIVNAQENPPESRTKNGRRQWRSNGASEALADLGHNVIRWRSSFSHQSKDQLVDFSCLVKTDNYCHQYIYSPSYKRHLSWARFRNHRVLAEEFLGLAESFAEKPDVINVCNVPTELCHACVAFGENHDIPVIVDVRDLWPDSYANFIPEKLRLLKPLAIWVFNKCFFKIRFSYRKAAAITGITQPILDWGLLKAGRSQNTNDAVFPMAYPEVTSSATVFEENELKLKLGIPESAFVACYSGNIGYQTDFDTILNAAKLLNESSGCIYFVIAGSGPRLDELREMSSQLPNVIFPGWLNGSELTDLFKISSFGLIGFFNVPDYMMSIPNKFTEYVSAGLALICGTKGEMARWVGQYDCGILYTECDHVLLSKKMSLLVKNPLEVNRMMLNSKKLHKLHFHADRIFPKIAKHIELVGKSHSQMRRQ